ncbi:MAG: TIGR00730 family Rossman fold protein [Pseudomonadota bacterium]
MKICVFAGSSIGKEPIYARAAQDLGAVLASADIGLVYGGAKIGLMGQVDDAVLRHGGTVIGVIPQVIAQVEVAHEGLTELHVVPDMHSRKATMADLSDAFVALPGGIGSLEELFEVWTWTQLGIHTKPLGILNVNNFYSGLLAFLDHVRDEGFLKPGHRDLLQSCDSPQTLIDRLANLPMDTSSVQSKL